MPSEVMKPSNRTVEYSIDRAGDSLQLAFEGSLDVQTAPKIWEELVTKIEESDSQKVVVEAKGISYCDGTGIGLLLQLQRMQVCRNADFEIKNLSDRFSSLLERYNPEDFADCDKIDASTSCLPEQVGRGAHHILGELKTMIAFLGELAVGLFKVALHPGKLRWRDAFLYAEKAGVDAIPIITLISFLIGLIMAFQSVVPMKQFGAEIFVADLVALSVVKELGPLMTAIILAGRSGSAFAAEIGTMKVNEEVNALTTFGIDPVHFLVLPRVIATACVTPLLAVLANFCGLLGGATVATGLNIPLVVYVQRTFNILQVDDLMGGLVKAFVFGALIAAIGCLRGIQTEKGATAVGDSTTKSVVAGILAIIIADGIFSVMYYNLGI